MSYVIVVRLCFNMVSPTRNLSADHFHNLLVEQILTSCFISTYHLYCQYLRVVLFVLTSCFVSTYQLFSLVLTSCFRWYLRVVLLVLTSCFVSTYQLFCQYLPVVLSVLKRCFVSTYQLFCQYLPVVLLVLTVYVGVRPYII